MEARFGLGLLRGMGSQYYYSSAGQEFSGHGWVTGRVFGKQYNIAIPDEHRSRMLVAPRKSETARITNIHMALRPETDALYPGQNPG